MSRMVGAMVSFRQPVGGRYHMNFMSVHLHCHTAKRKSGLADARDNFFRRLAGYIRGGGCNFVGGDWSMSS